MLKQHLLKLAAGAAIILMLGGVAFGAGAPAAKVVPAQHLLACAWVYPSCV